MISTVLPAVWEAACVLQHWQKNKHMCAEPLVCKQKLELRTVHVQLKHGMRDSFAAHV